MLSRPRLRTLPLRQLFQNAKPLQRRTLIAAPKDGSGPLMERRSDRALPPLSSPNRWLRTLPVFAAIMAACTLAIFNYQKSNSSVVSSALYSLRTNEEARRILGDEVYFAQQLPWIWGSIDQVHGNIDVSFMVKGTKGKAMMRFRSVRRTRMGFVSIFAFRCFFLGCGLGGDSRMWWSWIADFFSQFETVEWSLTPEGGETVSLLDGTDPFQKEE
jgi:cytochrome c oxidase assembly factor 1